MTIHADFFNRVVFRLKALIQKIYFEINPFFCVMFATVQN